MSVRTDHVPFLLVQFSASISLTCFQSFRLTTMRLTVSQPHVSQLLGLTLSQPLSLTMSQPLSLTVSQPHYVSAPQPHFVSAPQPHCVSASLCLSPSASLCPSPSASLCPSPSASLCPSPSASLWVHCSPGVGLGPLPRNQFPWIQIPVRIDFRFQFDGS